MNQWQELWIEAHSSLATTVCNGPRGPDQPVRPPMHYGIHYNCMIRGCLWTVIVKEFCHQAERLVSSPKALILTRTDLQVSKEARFIGPIVFPPISRLSCQFKSAPIWRIRRLIRLALVTDLPDMNESLLWHKPSCITSWVMEGPKPSQSRQIVVPLWCGTTDNVGKGDSQSNLCKLVVLSMGVRQSPSVFNVLGDCLHKTTDIPEGSVEPDENFCWATKCVFLRWVQAIFWPTWSLHTALAA